MTQKVSQKGNLIVVRLTEGKENFDFVQRLDRFVGDGQSVVIRSLALCCTKAAVRSVDVSFDEGGKFATFPLLRESVAGRPELVAPMASASDTDFVLSDFVMPPGWSLRVSTTGDPGADSTLQVLFAQGTGL